MHLGCIAPLGELLSVSARFGRRFAPDSAGKCANLVYRAYDPTESKGRPYIYMNGAIVGISEQGYAFYRDVLAGVYHVPVESFRDVALVPGQQAYVKILWSWVELGRNFSRDTFYDLIIPPTFAQAEISHYPFLATAEP
jgi:hypothetical protein